MHGGSFSIDMPDFTALSFDGNIVVPGALPRRARPHISRSNGMQVWQSSRLGHSTDTEAGLPPCSESLPGGGVSG
eukprot:928066-Alexandrium_andersonii.AAC.1